VSKFAFSQNTNSTSGTLILRPLKFKKV